MKNAGMKFTLVFVVSLAAGLLLVHKRGEVVEFPLAEAAVVGISPTCSGIIVVCKSEYWDAVWDAAQNCGGGDDNDDSDSDSDNDGDEFFFQVEDC